MNAPLLDARARVMLRRVEWRLRRRVATPWAGDHQSSFHGKGMEFEQVVRYAFGDDVRDIDWNVTARLGEAYRKVFVEDRDVPLVVMFSDHPALQFGSGAVAKRDVLLQIAGLTLLLGIAGQQRVMLIHDRPGGPVFHPPSRGRAAALGRLGALFAAPPPQPAPGFAGQPLPPVQLPRDAVFVWLGEIPPGEPPLAWRVLARRHSCLAIRVEDGWERDPPRIAGIVHDPVSGQSFSAGDPPDAATHARWRADREARWRAWWPDANDRLVTDIAADPLTSLSGFLLRRGARSAVRR